MTKFAVGDLVGVGCFVDSCRECEPCRARRGAVLRRRHGFDLQRHRARSQDADLRRLLHARSSWTSGFVAQHPGRPRPPRPPAPLLCAGITTLFAAAPLRLQGRAIASPWSDSAASATWRVKLATAMGARRHGAQHVAARSRRTRAPRRDEFVATQDPAAFSAARRPLRPRARHRLGAARLQRATSACCGATGTMVLRGRAARRRTPVAAFALIVQRRAPGRLADRRHRRDPGDARLLRRAQHARDIEVIPIQTINEA